MPEEPVTIAAANFKIVIRAFATSAPSTAHMDRDSSYQKGGLRMDYGGKIKRRQKIKVKSEAGKLLI
jgi:hypothetical protein